MKVGTYMKTFLPFCKGILSWFLLFCLWGACDAPEMQNASTENIGHPPSPVIKRTDQLYDISVAEEDHLWVVGYFGAAFYSDDGGKHWTKKDMGTKESLLGVHFINKDHGWVVGDSGTILHTNDRGVTWEKQKSPIPDEKLLKVQFIDEKQGWAVGTYGVILHTEDSGLTWKRLPFEEDVVLNDLCFINSRQGWLAGEFGMILHTEDGGQNWITQLEDEMGRKLFGIAFRNEMHGIAVGTQGVIYTTKNGGKKWHLNKTSADDTLLKVSFVDDSLATAIGLRGCITMTADGGDHWSSTCPPYHFTWLSGIVFRDDGRGFTVGDAGKILVSNDKGVSWIPYTQLTQHTGIKDH